MSGQPDGGERVRLGSPVDAQSRRFAIIGDSIDHLRAPVVWSARFRRFGVNAVVLPAHVEAAGFDAAICGLKAVGCMKNAWRSRVPPP